MVAKALEKLNENQTKYLKTISYFINRAKTNVLKEEFERQSGKLSGYLECLLQMEIITMAEMKSLRLWFSEADRS